MIYWQQTFNLSPADYATRDAWVEFAANDFVPLQTELGGRLLGAWFNHEEWFSQIMHVTEFADLPAFDAYRARFASDSRGEKADRVIDGLAPERSGALLEEFGPIAPERVHRAVDEAVDAPKTCHTLAILDVVPEQMEPFRGLVASAGALPLIASWRAVGGNPNQILDLWEGRMSPHVFSPNTPENDAFFRPLRQMAPRERMLDLYPLPYSPLR